MSFIEELKRRSVVKVGIAYIIVAWVLLQVGEVLGPALRLPEWVNSALAFFLILGFPIALFFAWAFDLTPEGIKRDGEDKPADLQQVLGGRKVDFLIILLLVVAVVFFAWDNFTGETPLESAQRGEDIVTVSSASSTNSIAVLPFINISGDEENEFFSDGVSEEILNVLARVPELKVAARTSAFAFKGTNQTISAIAEELNVNHVLEGSVRKAGNRVRVTSQLVKADDGFQLWSATYDRELDDIFAIQDEISAEIANALKLTLALDSGDSGNLTGTQSLASYESYLRGMALWHERTAESLTQAISEFEKAQELDPNFAKAYAGLALVWTVYDGYVAGDFNEMTNQAERAADRALELDPENVEAITAKASVASVTLDYDAAKILFERAIELNPSFATAYQWYARLSGYQGDRDREIELLEKAKELDPRASIISYNLAWSYWVSGEKQRAIELIEQALAKDPDFPDGLSTLLMFNLIERNCPEVERIAERIVGKLNKVEDKSSVYVSLCLAETDEDRGRLMDEILSWGNFEFANPEDPSLTYDLEFIMVPVAYGDFDRGLRMLEVLARNWAPQNLDWYRHTTRDNMAEFNCLEDVQSIYAGLNLPESSLDPVCP